MGEQLKKPYEISVWEDNLVTQNGQTFYKETKIAVIGSNTMRGMNKVYDPVFTEKTNGEKTLTFSLRYKYFEPFGENEGVINPFAALLVNERKIKLKYDNIWHEFIIKDHVESSDGLVWSYTCTDAFVLELSKTGYDLEFNSELGNNQGTAEELATAVLKDTDWTLKSANVGKQTIEEPLYSATLVSPSNVTIINTDTNQKQILEAGPIYVFYSFVANKDGKFVHFIIRDTSENPTYTIDDKNNIVATNYRINDTLTFDSTTSSFKKDSTIILQIDAIESQYHAYRTAYNQLTTYDPVTQKVVDRYRIGGGEEVYSYKESVQLSSNVLTNFIVNGEDFNIYQNGTLQGWDADTQPDGTAWQKIELTTNPVISSTDNLVNLAQLQQIEGYLKPTFAGNGYISPPTIKNAIFNSGMQDNIAQIQRIVKGERFVFRWRATRGLTSKTAQDLRLIVANYTEVPYDLNTGRTDEDGLAIIERKYIKRIVPNSIILDFGAATGTLNNYIRGGTLSNNNTIYSIDNVPQTPSTRYIYVVGSSEYVWDSSQGKFVTKTSSNYLPYRYSVASALRSVTEDEIRNGTTNIGIFIYCTGLSGRTTCYIQDIQLTRYMLDKETNLPATIGNIPNADPIEQTYYYIKPKPNTNVNEVNMYTNLAALTEDIRVDVSLVKPIYNTNSEKFLTINESHSNCFNILQSIAETFECWIDLQVIHKDNGEIELDENNNPKKYVYLKEYVGHDNWAGFKYGININSIERTVNSDEIVTKLYVDQITSDCVDKGYVSINDARSNPSGEEYIYNFDYYYNQNLLDKQATQNQLNQFNSNIKTYNNQISKLNARKLTLESTLLGLNSQRTVLKETIDEAKQQVNRSLNEFKELANGVSYETYVSKHMHIPEASQLTTEANLADVVGNIYTYSATINSYSGILTNIEQEYNDRKKELKGLETFYITLSVVYDTTDQRNVVVSVSSYDAPLSFILDGQTYDVSVTQNYFTINSLATTITFINNNTTTYKFGNSTAARITVGVDDSRIVKYKLKPKTSTDAGIIGQIDELTESKKELVNSFNHIYRRFIQEGTWNGTDYVDSELYYLDALQISHTSAWPQVTYSINVVDVSQIENLKDYNFQVGDKTYIEDTEFFGWHIDNVGTNEQPIYVKRPAREEVIISQIEWHLDEPNNNNITVQNYKTRFEDLFQRISAAVQTVQYNEATYAKISTLLDQDGSINQNALLAALNRAAGAERPLTSDGSVMIAGDEILIQNLQNKSNCVILNSKGIRISSDAGKTWTTAIDGRGINIGTVYTGLLNTDKIIIGSEDNPSFRWDKSGISAYEKNGDDDTYNLKTFVRYDQYGLYGIKNNSTFKANDVEDIKEKAHFAVTWDGFFIKNSYTGGGRVEITSENDFRVLKTINNEEKEVIKIGALEWNGSTTPIAGVSPSLYGIRITNDQDIETFKTGNDGNVTITGTINATSGNFTGIVNVGATNQDHIIINGSNASIQSSTYQDGAGNGWLLTKEGDAYFNNITARGAIKTAVFEYAEIQAVGGIFIFRPSSTIRSARVEGNDLIITVEKSILFRSGQWCKVSNYLDKNQEAIDTQSILLNNGLTHVYEVLRTQGSNDITLLGGARMVVGNDAIVESVEDLVGGALVDMGNKEEDPVTHKIGTSNYGIGINSSDNTVNLPARAISLFETVVDETHDPKITYKYRGILGTLPVLQYTGSNAQVSQLYNDNLAGTQGIYTDNMYIGDHDQYLTYYTIAGTDQKRLKIRANQFEFEVVNPETGESEWKNVEDATEGADAIYVMIDSTAGNFFQHGQVSTYLVAHVYRGSEEITNQFSTFHWYRRLPNGNVDPTWSTQETSNLLQLTTADVDERAVFVCEVTIA